MCVLEAETGLRELGKILFTVVLALLSPLPRVEGIKYIAVTGLSKGPPVLFHFIIFPFIWATTLSISDTHSDVFLQSPWIQMYP